MANYWYKTTTYFCPVCGRERWVTERQPLPKPTDWTERYIIIESYDNCEE